MFQNPAVYQESFINVEKPLVQGDPKKIELLKNPNQHWLPWGQISHEHDLGVLDPA